MRINIQLLNIRKNKTLALGLALFAMFIAALVIKETYTLDQVIQMLCMRIYPSQSSTYIPRFCYGIG